MSMLLDVMKMPDTIGESGLRVRCWRADRQPGDIALTSSAHGLAFVCASRAADGSSLDGLAATIDGERAEGDDIRRLAEFHIPRCLEQATAIIAAHRQEPPR